MCISVKCKSSLFDHAVFLFGFLAPTLQAELFTAYDICLSLKLYLIATLAKANVLSSLPIYLPFDSVYVQAPPNN